MRQEKRHSYQDCVCHLMNVYQIKTYALKIKEGNNSPSLDNRKEFLLIVTLNRSCKDIIVYLPSTRCYSDQYSTFHCQQQNVMLHLMLSFPFYTTTAPENPQFYCLRAGVIQQELQHNNKITHDGSITSLAVVESKNKKHDLHDKFGKLITNFEISLAVFMPHDITNNAIYLYKYSICVA